jgi:hypothetical protein
MNGAAIDRLEESRDDVTASSVALVLTFVAVVCRFTREPPDEGNSQKAEPVDGSTPPGLRGLFHGYVASKPLRKFIRG